MPTNQNLSKNGTADENGNNVIKSLVLNPSEPMYRAFMEYCTEREANLWGIVLGADDDPIDADLKRGMKTDVLREALTAFLNAKGKTWVEPESERTSDMFDTWRKGGSIDFKETRDGNAVIFGPALKVSPHAQRSDETNDAYRARYKEWYTAIQQDKIFYRQNHGDLAVAQMGKLQSLMGMGMDAVEAMQQAMLAFPPGTIVRERRTRQKKG